MAPMHMIAVPKPASSRPESPPLARRRLAGANGGLAAPPPLVPRLSATVHDWKRIAIPVPPPVVDERKPERRIMVRRVTVFDPDQLSDIIPGANIEHRLLQPGPFEARALRLETKRFRLDYLRYSTNVALTGELPAGGVVIALALRMREDMVAFGAPQHSSTLMQINPAAGLDLRLPAGGEWILITFDSAVFQSEFVRRCGDSQNVAAAVQLPLRIAGPRWRRLAPLLRSVVDEAGTSPGAAQDPAETRALDAALFEAVLDAYASARPPRWADHGALARRRRLVSRAEDYLYAHVDDSIRMKGLCRDVGASARTLEYAFKGVYGIGVMESLRILRLNEVRKKLLRAGAEEVTVTTAAMDWGFWHLGEFAAGYKRLFGELPSQTLQSRKARLHATRPVSERRAGHGAAPAMPGPAVAAPAADGQPWMVTARG